MFTRWCSIKKSCLAKNVYLHHNVLYIDAAFDVLNKLLKPLTDVSIRFANTVNKSGNIGLCLIVWLYLDLTHI